jgi:N12 class adenine-specific DNA methylase
MEYMGRLLGKDAAAVEQELLDTGKAFRNPKSGLVEPEEEYLSGEVRKKLVDARAAAEDDAVYAGNVKALEAVQPKLVPLETVQYRIGSTWIPAQAYERFMRDVLGVEARSSGTAMNDLSKAALLVGSDTQLVGINASQAADAMTKGNMDDLLRLIINGGRPVARVAPPAALRRPVAAAASAAAVTTRPVAAKERK